MGLFSKFLKSANTTDITGIAGIAGKPVEAAADDASDEDIVLGSGTAKAIATPEKRGAEKRRHPRVVQTTAGGVYSKPRFWVYGDRECYEDPNDDSSTLSLDAAKQSAAMPRPDLDGKVELPRYLKKRGDKPS